MRLMLPALLALCALAQTASSATEAPVLAPQVPVPTPGFSLKNTANFDELRHNVLELIGSSRKRVWLITDYLTDGDVVSALFLAKYRKVDVKVFLGRSKQNQYLSRLNYLKAQNIPVFTRPEHGFVAPTLLFADQKLYTITRDLNSLARVGQSQIAQASPADVKNFVSWFREALEYPEPAVLKPGIQAGRARNLNQAENRRPAAVEDDAPAPLTPAASSYDGESDGSYNYDRSKLSRRPPEGVPTRLPKIPVWLKNRDIQQKNPSPPIAPTPPVPVDSNAQPEATAPTSFDAVGSPNAAPAGQFPEERP